MKQEKKTSETNKLTKAWGGGLDPPPSPGKEPLSTCSWSQGRGPVSGYVPANPPASGCVSADPESGDGRRCGLDESRKWNKGRVRVRHSGSVRSRSRGHEVTGWTDAEQVDPPSLEGVGLRLRPGRGLWRRAGWEPGGRGGAGLDGRQRRRSRFHRCTLEE